MRPFRLPLSPWGALLLRHLGVPEELVELLMSGRAATPALSEFCVPGGGLRGIGVPRGWLGRSNGATPLHGLYNHAMIAKVTWHIR